MAYTRYSNLDLLNLPDCYALLENGKCKCLDVPVCLGENCSYYYDDQKRIFARLRSLNEEKQAHISQKYYEGKRPWTECEAKP